MRTVTELATGGLQPNLTLFFDLPVETALARMASRDDAGEQKNRMDSETADFYGRVREAYLEIARRQSERFRTVDATISIEEIHAQVSEIVMSFLNSKRNLEDAGEIAVDSR